MTTYRLTATVELSLDDTLAATAPTVGLAALAREIGARYVGGAL